MTKVLALSLCLFAFVGLSETQTAVNTLKFQTLGYDCYAEVDEEGFNVPVLEGECYALVWKSNEVTEFPGLPVNPPNPKNPAVNGIWVAQYFPVAADAGDLRMHCPEVTINGLDKNDDANGKWTVYLLDTRYLDENGEVACGFDESVTNAPHCINAYTPIVNLVDFTIGTSAAYPSGGTMKTTSLTGGKIDEYGFVDQVADVVAVLPSDCPVPQFSAITNAGENVTLTVTNTAPYLMYGLSMTNDLAKVSSTTNYVGGWKQGVGAGPLTWTVPVGDQPAGFFQLRRVLGFGN